MIFLNQRKCEAVFFLPFAYVFSFTFLFCISMNLKVEDNFYKSANIALSRQPHWLTHFGCIAE